jgi:hypothetical protein
MVNLTQAELDELKPAQLKDRAKRGIVRVMSTMTKPLARICYTDLPQYKKHARLKGSKISQREASRLYKIPVNTISQWTARGLINVLERTDREMYIDQADVAYCAEIRAERRGSGYWLFNRDRTPYVPTTRTKT